MQNVIYMYICSNVYKTSYGHIENWEAIYIAEVHLELIASLYEVTVHSLHLGAVSIRKTVLPGMAISMLKIRRPNGRLIFNMEITIRR